VCADLVILQRHFDSFVINMLFGRDFQSGGGGGIGMLRPKITI